MCAVSREKTVYNQNGENELYVGVLRRLTQYSICLERLKQNPKTYFTVTILSVCPTANAIAAAMLRGGVITVTLSWRHTGSHGNAARTPALPVSPVTVDLYV